MRGGAQGRNRTTDTVIFSHVLYQLSYLGDPFDVETIAWGSGRSCGISLSSGRREVPTRSAAADLAKRRHSYEKRARTATGCHPWGWRGSGGQRFGAGRAIDALDKLGLLATARQRGPRRWRCQCPQQRSRRGTQGSRRARSTGDAGSFRFSLIACHVSKAGNFGAGISILPPHRRRIGASS